jgi:23S rRNA (adenine2503-C2)-methyltransferase
MTSTKKDIRALSEAQIIDILKEKGEAKFRAKQIYEWLWKKTAHSFDDMSNLSKPLRDWLNETFVINAVTVSDMQVSNDKTIKCAMKLADGNVVESVLIPTKSRMTACISSQVGCSLTCKFCATGKLKRLRNLNADEIYDQVALVKNLAETKYNQALTNIVYMGMGEPLLNYAETIRSVDRITSPDGLGMSPSRITVSTAGIAKMIMKLGDDQVKFNLALSLHAANDEKRNHIMPINESNSLDNLEEALNYFYEKTGSRVTLNILYSKILMMVIDARELGDFCKKTTAKVNIIEYNPIDDGEFKQTTPERLEAFVKHLEGRGIIVNVRRSRGKDIDAACGQLVNKNKSTVQVFK